MRGRTESHRKINKVITMNNSPLQKGIYVHGLGSGANTDMLQSVQKHLPMFDWYAVEVNEDLAQSVKIINAAIEIYRP